ncbi:MAG: protein kinase domain-containing protein [Bradymonadia bacterium]
MTFVQVGDVLNGYRLLEPIAEGGMGAVWKAKHPNLERWVAIKLIKPELVSTEHVKELFLDEVNHLSRLRSPQIVQVLDSGITEARGPFMVTEYLPGDDLATRLERRGAFPVGEVCRIGLDVLRALSEAHAMGIVHGDLKPSNIFLMTVEGQREPAVKVLDFGVASLIEGGQDDESTLGSRIIRGSIQYMSPEQLTQSKLTPASDLYTFGATLYSLLTNSSVFNGEPQEQIRRKLSESAPVLDESKMVEMCPPALSELILNCLERKPSDRPSSAQALYKRLEYVMNNLSTTVEVEPTTTAVDVSVPDWLQSGFSHSGSGHLETTHKGTQLELDDGSESSLELRTERSTSGGEAMSRLIEPPVDDADSLTLADYASRTMEQPPPSILQSSDSSGSQHFARETVESAPKNLPKRTSSNAYLIYILLGAVIVLSGALFLLGSEKEETQKKAPRTLRQVEMDETASRLKEAKQLLAKLEANAPKPKRKTAPRAEVDAGDIVLALPRGLVARFSNADTKARLCAQMVMSCRVPRNVNVEIRAPNFLTKVISASELRTHSAELKHVRLVKRKRNKSKK